MVKLPKRINVRGEGIVDTEMFIMLQTDAMNEKSFNTNEGEVREQLARVYNNLPCLEDADNNIWRIFNATVLDRVI